MVVKKHEKEEEAAPVVASSPSPWDNASGATKFLALLLVLTPVVFVVGFFARLAVIIFELGWNVI